MLHIFSIQHTLPNKNFTDFEQSTVLLIFYHTPLSHAINLMKRTCPLFRDQVLLIKAFSAYFTYSLTFLSTDTFLRISSKYAPSSLYPFA